MIVYLAGPMSGYDDFNRPAFDAAATFLRERDYTVLSPAELFDHTDLSWDFYMRASIRLMLNADAVVLLPGWEKSRGAVIEHDLAYGLEMGIYTLENGYIQACWREEAGDVRETPAYKIRDLERWCIRGEAASTNTKMK